MAKTNNPKAAIFPGSFDPMTNGHLDIIERSLEIFDTLTVAVLENSTKTPLFSIPERIDLMVSVCEKFSGRVKVKSFSGLLVAFSAQEGIPTIVRGLRAISDYDYEAQMALMNKNLNPSVETVFLIAREENSYISSSIVKQAAILGGKIDQFVPETVRDAIYAKVAKG